MKLWKFDVSCGRMGTLNGLFFAAQEDIDRIMGKEVYFGEVLGKHSDVNVKMGPEDLRELTLSASAVQELRATIGGNTLCGHNPFDYLEDEEEDDAPIDPE